LISTLLKKKGHTVGLAKDGAEAVEMASTSSFDLVLMDVQMPRVDGLEATRRIRRLEEGTNKRLPVVALTAHAMEEQKEECLAAGMDGFLSKPIDRDALTDLLDHHGKRVEEGAAPVSPASPVHGPGGTPSQVEVEATPDVGSPTEAVSPKPAAGLFDLDRISDLVGGDEEVLGELVSMFLEDSTGLLGRIRSGLDAGDPPAVEAAAHQLKGSSSNFRSPQVTEPAFRIEELAREGDLRAAAELFPGLEKALLELHTAIRHLGGPVAS